jgi:hypothetical protein
MSPWSAWSAGRITSMQASTWERMTRSFNQRPRRFIPPGRTLPAMFALAPLLAHQGGWDELLLVVAPIVIIVGILAIVKRRVDKMGPPPPT